MPLLYHLAAILLTALLLGGVVDSLPAVQSRWRSLWRAGAWGGTIGGGVYGLGFFDSNLLPGFSWASLAIVIVGGLLCSFALRQLFHAE